MKSRFLATLAICCIASAARPAPAPDALVVTGPNLQQLPISRLLITPTGGTQATLGYLLSGSGLNLSSPSPIGDQTPNTGAFTTLGVAGAVAISGSASSPWTMQFGVTSTPVPNTTVTPMFLGYNSGAAFHFSTSDIYGALAVGDETLQYLTSINSEDVAIGPLACQYITTGQTNTCFGYHALGADSISSANTAIGNDALRDAITYNGHGWVTAVGKWTLANGNPDIGTVAIGAEALMGDSSAIIIGGTPTTGDVITYTFNSTFSSFGNSFIGLPVSKTYGVQPGDTAISIATAIASGYTSAGVIGNSFQLQAAAFALPDGTAAVRLTYMGSTTTGWQGQITATWNGGATETAAVIGGSRPQKTTVGGYQSLFGPAMGITTDNTAWGWSDAINCTTCSGMSLFGSTVGSKVTSASNSTLIGFGVGPTHFATGSGVILLGSGAQTVDTPAAGTSNYINVENILTVTGTDTPSTSVSKVAGTLNVAGSYQANGAAGFSGTKTAGSCVLTISGGIITNVTGC